MKFQDLRRFNLDTLIVFKGALSLIRDPQQTDSVYDIEDGMKNIAILTDFLRKMILMNLRKIKFGTVIEQFKQLFDSPE
jgi:hypothetical protein